MENLLITGGDGFIGKNLQDKVEDCFVYDLTKDRDIREEIDAPPTDKVVHLAAITGHKECANNPKSALNTNVQGTRNVLEHARKNDADMVFASSCAVYGETTEYSQTKKTGESLCRTYSELFGMNVVILRLSNVYGPHSEHKKSVVAKFAKKASRKEPLTVEGDGSQTRDFVYAPDVCEAILSGLKYGGSETFDVGTGKEVSINKLADIIQDYFDGVEVTHVSLPDYRKEEPRDPLSVNRTKDELNVEFKSIEEGLRRWLSR